MAAQLTSHEPGAPVDSSTDLPVGGRATVVAQRANENVFQVLAAHARTQPPVALGMTAIAAAIDATMLMRLHPSLAWLAAGCASVASYGIWGVLDQAVRSRVGRSSAAGIIRLAVRDLAAVLGTGSALWAVWAFMAAAIGNWNH